MVYRAAMLGSDGFEKPVAIKLLRLGGGDGRLAEEAQQRFRDEARLLGLLRHRAIVQVDGLVRIGGHQAVVMEYLEGVSLRALVKRAPIPEGPAFEIVAEVAAALEAAWHRPGPAGRPLNVCHRDLKPANLQLSADGELKVLDFGIARADFQAREAETRSLAMGSVEYMSPSRLDFDDDGAAGDIYSLGCVLYEMLVGEAFGRTSANPKSHAARFEANIGRVPEGAREMIARMLAFDATERPGAREVERKCLEMSRAEPLRLRDWAADAVPDCFGATKVANGSWTGKLLAEDSEDQEPVVAEPEVRASFVVGVATGVAPTVASPRAEQRVLDVKANGGLAGSGPVSKAMARSGPITAATRSGPITGSGPMSGSRTSGARRAAPQGAGTATKAGAAALGVMGVGSLAAGGILLVVAAVFAWREFAPAPKPEPPLVVSAPLPQVILPGSQAPTLPSLPELVEVPVPLEVVEVKPGAASGKPVASAKPVTATPEVAPAGASATIELSGNAEAVRLRLGEAHYALPKVPAGTYTVLATFDGKEVEAGTVTAGEGEAVLLKCKKAFLRCSR